MTPQQLQQAAERALAEGRQALAGLFAHEAVLALEAKHLAAHASDVAMSNIAPSYRPTARLAVEAAREMWPDLAERWDEPPW